jgi:hypothetical protein
MEEDAILAVVRWVAFAVVFVAFLWIASCNLWTVIRAILWHKPGSRGFLLGGLLGMLALLIASFELFARYWWVPLVVDAGSLPLVVETILFFLLGRPLRELAKTWLLIGAFLAGVLVVLVAILLLEMCGFTGINDGDCAAGIAGAILAAGFVFLFRVFNRTRRAGEGHKDGE